MSDRSSTFVLIFWLLAIGPLTHDLSQAEKKINVFTSWGNAKNDIFLSKLSKLPFCAKTVVIFSVAQLMIHPADNYSYSSLSFR